MKVIMVNCFCTELPNSGNPAAVVFDFSGDQAERQKLAKQLNLPVTVFIDNAEAVTPVLQFFYPGMETNLCLHGALAAVYILLKQRKLDNIVVSTTSGKLLEAIKYGETAVQIKVSAEPAPIYTVDPVVLTQLLNVVADEISKDLPMTVASVGSPKLLVPVKSFAILSALTPDFVRIKQWSLDNQINGLYVYAQESSFPLLFQARNFNPKTGQNEDAATGVAAAALASVLRKDLLVKQGQSLDKPSLIMVTYRRPEEIYVGGKALEQVVKIKVPNSRTRKAMDELESSKGKRLKNIRALMEDLDNEDD